MLKRERGRPKCSGIEQPHVHAVRLCGITRNGSGVHTILVYKLSLRKRNRNTLKHG